MEIIKLSNLHMDAVRPLFTKTDYMGVDSTKDFFMNPAADFLQVAYDAFTDTYLSGLNSFHAYGCVENGIVVSYISFYESMENAEWYGTQIRSIQPESIKYVLDKVIEHNENNGRYKFYSLFNSKHGRAMRKLFFSEFNKERYGSVDECIIPAKTRCIYTMPWNVLFNRTLVPTDTLLRLSYLKQEYRPTTPIAGNI